MKLHLPLILRRSLIAAITFAALGATIPSQAETVVTEDTTYYNDTHLYLDRDIQLPVVQDYGSRGYLVFDGARQFDGQGHTITGQHTGVADESYEDFLYSDNFIQIGGYNSGSGTGETGTTLVKNLTVKDTDFYLYGDTRFENVTLRGWVNIDCYGMSCNLEGLTLASGGYLCAYLVPGATLEHSYTLKSNMELNLQPMDWYDVGEFSQEGAVTVAGDLELAGGSIVLGWGNWISDQCSYSSSDLETPRLIVNGTLNATAPSNIAFEGTGPVSDEYLGNPVADQAVIKCTDFEGNISNLRPCSIVMPGNYGEEPLYVDGQDTGGYIMTNTDNLTTYSEPIEGMSFESVAEADGYLIYLRQGGSVIDPDDPGTPDTPVEPTIPVITSGDLSDESGTLGQDYSIDIADGATVDTTALTATTLDGNAISGSGTLATGSDQTITITANSDITYSVSGSSEGSAGATLELGSDGGSITSQMSRIDGGESQQLQLSGLNVKSGVLTNQRSVSSENAIAVGSENGSAALNNYGTINAKAGMAISANSSVDNRGTITTELGDIVVQRDAILANNSEIKGNILVEEGGLLKGTGTATSATISGTLNVGNSPGFQSYETLTLNAQSHLIFTVDGTTPATLEHGGAGTYSNIAVTTPNGFTVNGKPTAEVIFTNNAVLGSLQNGDTEIPLTFITVNDGNGGYLDATTTSGISYSVGGELANFITLTADGSGQLIASLNSAAVIVGMGDSAGDLVNTLWTSTGVLNSFARQAAARISPEARLINGESAGKLSVWASGLGDFMNVGGVQGFTYSGGGYAVGVDGLVPLCGDLRVGLAFGQQFGTFKSDALGTHVDQDSTMVALYAGYSDRVTDRISWQISGYAAYGNSENDSRTSLGGITTGRGDWNTDTGIWGLKAEAAYAYSDRASIGAFIGIDYLYGSMDSFNELYDSGLSRQIGRGAMQVWRLPIGITWRGQYSLGGTQYLLPSMSLAYVGDISRSNPHADTSILGYEQRVHGTNIGRNGLLLNLGTTWLINENWSASAAYSLEVRSRQTAQSCNLGVRYTF